MKDRKRMKQPIADMMLRGATLERVAGSLGLKLALVRDLWGEYCTDHEGKVVLQVSRPHMAVARRLEPGGAVIVGEGIGESPNDALDDVFGKSGLMFKDIDEVVR